MTEQPSLAGCVTGLRPSSTGVSQQLVLPGEAGGGQLAEPLDPGEQRVHARGVPGVERLRELSAACFAWQDELLRSAG